MQAAEGTAKHLLQQRLTRKTLSYKESLERLNKTSQALKGADRREVLRMWVAILKVRS